MTVNSIASTGIPASSVAPLRQSLGQSDFIRLMTTQMLMQDPTDPVDNKETIAQMAQFSALSGLEDINSTLEFIAIRLDQIFAAQTAAQPTPNDT